MRPFEPSNPVIRSAYLHCRTALFFEFRRNPQSSRLTDLDFLTRRNKRLRGRHQQGRPSAIRRTRDDCLRLASYHHFR